MRLVGSTHWEGDTMHSLRGSLEDMVDASANAVLTSDGTMAGKAALLRMTLLLNMLEGLDAGGDLWEDVSLLPEAIPSISDHIAESAAELPN